jgi:nitrate reductase beta subunit
MDVGLSEADTEDLFRLLAIARYEDRYVVPPAHAEDAGRLMAQHSLSGCSLESEGGPGMGGDGPYDEAVPGFHLRRQEPDDVTATGRDSRGRLHLGVSESPPRPPVGPGAFGAGPLGPATPGVAT